MDILLSLKPVHAKAILSRKKRYEFRRVIFKNPEVKRAYIYVTAPVSKIVGSFSIGKIMSGTPKDIWQKCKKYAGICAEDFFRYYEGCKCAFAIEIAKVHNFLDPLDPYSKIPDFRPPQSFCYVNDEIFSENLLENGIRKMYLVLTNWLPSGE